MTARDYADGWDETSALIRRTGAETGVAEAAYDRLEAFCRGLPEGSICEVLSAFAMPDMSRAAAESDEPSATTSGFPMPASSLLRPVKQRRLSRDNSRGTRCGKG